MLFCMHSSSPGPCICSASSAPPPPRSPKPSRRVTTDASKVLCHASHYRYITNVFGGSSAMSNTSRRKELQDNYKNSHPEAGVYRLVNSQNGKALLGSVVNL